MPPVPKRVLGGSSLPLHIWVALSNMVFLGGLLHTQASFASNKQPAFFSLISACCFSLSTRSTLPLSLVFHTCCLQILTSCLTPRFRSPLPHLTSLFFSLLSPVQNQDPSSSSLGCGNCQQGSSAAFLRCPRRR